MALGMHKPGEGYWVRVLTASLIGLLTVSLALWAAAQMRLVSEKLPRTQWSMRIDPPVATTPAPGTPAPAIAVGQLLSLRGQPDQAGLRPKIGTATVTAYDNDEKKVTIGDAVMNAGRDPSESSQLISGESSTAEFVANVQARSVAGLPAIEPILLEGGVAGVIILIGAVLAWYFAATRVRTVEFLIATDYEMKKVNWSTPKEIVGSTWVVVCACVGLATTLFVIDLAFQGFFRLIGVLV